MTSSQPDYNFKVLLLGSAAVGKTSLVQKFVHDRFDSSYLMTIGMEPSEKHVNLKDGTKVALSIWDLAGQDRFRFIRPTFYKGAKAALLVFDLTRSTTLKDIRKWDKEFIDNCGSKVVKILVGNKEDLQKEKAISESECEDMNSKTKSKMYFNTSALSGKHVNEAFLKIAELLVKHAREME
ncbi:MAG: GTP-binding protein [Candidatus Heimdallarchaeota archaeon]|nr:GTP-binding protein [Candidatus Heimdallarchaeota archaeon]